MSSKEAEAERCEDGQANDVAEAGAGETASSHSSPAPSDEGDGESAKGPSPSASAPGRQPSAQTAVEATENQRKFVAQRAHDPRAQRHPATGSMPDRRDGLTTEERIVFPVLLHRIVSDPDTDDAIHWLACGTRFMLCDKKKFAALVLPRYYGHAKFTSFTRRLKRWDFTRIPSGPFMGAYVNINFVRGEPDRARLIRPLSIIPPDSKYGRKPSSGGVASSSARAANESGNSSTENSISNVNGNERELMMRQMMMAQIQMSMGMGGTNPQLSMAMGGASPNIVHTPQIGVGGMNPAMAFQTNGQMQGPTDPMAMMAMHEMMMQRHATAMSQYASMNSANNLGMDGPQNSSAQDIRGEDEQNLIRPQVQDSGGILETDRLQSWDGAARERVQQHYQGQMRSQQQEQGGVFQRMRGGGMPAVESGGMSTMDMNLHHQQQMNQQMMRQQQMQAMMGGGMANGGLFNNVNGWSGSMQGRPEASDMQYMDSATRTEL